jgi:hypothetical protein
MTIETIALLSFVFMFVFMAFALAAMAYERRTDVLYGPYIHGRDARYPIAPLVDVLQLAISERLTRLRCKARNVSYFALVIMG